VHNINFRPSSLLPKCYCAFTVSYYHFCALIFTFQFPCFTSFAVTPKSWPRILPVSSSLVSGPKQSNSTSVSACLMRTGCHTSQQQVATRLRSRITYDKQLLLHEASLRISLWAFQQRDLSSRPPPPHPLWGIIYMQKDRDNIVIQLKRDISHFCDSYVPQRPQFWGRISEQQIMLTLIV
jgi:hypothetical protein